MKQHNENEGQKKKTIVHKSIANDEEVEESTKDDTDIALIIRKFKKRQYVFTVEVSRVWWVDPLIFGSWLNRDDVYSCEYYSKQSETTVPHLDVKSTILA